MKEPIVVQLDDDLLVLQTWALAARQRGVPLRQFREPAAFLAALASLPHDTKLFLDARLGDGVKGEEIARAAFALGFREIYLATGLPPDAFPNLPWVKGFVGKDPPWLANG